MCFGLCQPGINLVHLSPWLPSPVFLLWTRQLSWKWKAGRVSTAVTLSFKKEGSSLYSVLDLCSLNSHLWKYTFRMLTHKTLCQLILTGSSNDRSVRCLFSHLSSKQELPQVCFPKVQPTSISGSHSEGVQQARGGGSWAIMASGYSPTSEVTSVVFAADIVLLGS